jgi:hypothetical protein
LHLRWSNRLFHNPSCGLICFPMKADFHSAENVARSTFSERFSNCAFALQRLEERAISKKNPLAKSKFQANKDGCRRHERTKFSSGRHQRVSRRHCYNI